MGVELFMGTDKIAFLDRDGVINKKSKDHDYIKSWQEFEFIDGASEFIHALNIMGYKVIIVTNQRGIALGKISMNDVDNIHKNMMIKLEKNEAHIDDIYICPHDKDECKCRKPEIGLFLKAEEKYDVDKVNSFMIGDSLTDIQAGIKYGIKSILFGNKHEGISNCYNNFDDIIKYILKGNHK
jgi:D-glycero-D-manno-heptose 1,7-bisphosphate phosphatase